MDIDEYQEEAKKTMQFDSSKSEATVISMLGLSGEIGSLSTEFKKNIRDGDSYKIFNSKIIEELGDVFWYLSSLASVNDIKLSEVLSSNLKKTKDRWIASESEGEASIYGQVNSDSEKTEILPDTILVEFKEVTNLDGGVKVQVYVDGEKFGDDLRDNSYDSDFYRYHDIFHFSYLTFLGWSPVARGLLGLKRRSRADVDEIEDGGRALVIDEAISILVFENARDHSFYEGGSTVDEEVLQWITQMTKHLEVSSVSSKSWEEAILEGFTIWRKLKQIRSGKILCSLKDRSIDFID